MPAGINASLIQQGKLGYGKELHIHDGQEVRVHLLTGARKKTYQVHLLALSNKGKSRINIAWPWLWCMTISLVGLLVYLLLVSILNIESGIINFAIILGCVAGVILGAVMLVLNFSRKRVYYSKCAHVPILDFVINKPDRKQYKKFVEALESYISEMQSAYNLKRDQQIAGEIRMLRRLANDGIVAQAVYNRAKDKLFNSGNR